MFFIVQLTKIIPMMDFYIPAQIEMYYGEVRKTIDFEMLDPDVLIQLVWPEETLMSLLLGDDFAQ